jgi:hypothetical protein
VHSWLRWLHVYISMVSLLVVLFFSLTGITLNHPEWTFGMHDSTSDLSGRLPQGWQQGNGVDWMTVVEVLRNEHGVRGKVVDRREEYGEGVISFKAPGYSADCVIDLETGAYRVSIASLGPVGVLNDLHRGRDAAGGWRWTIDLSGVFLTVLSLTGIGLLLYLKKMRVSALYAMVGGSLLVVLLMKLTM